MEQKRDIILVPWEFSSMNEIAFQHALQLAKAADNVIHMMHIEPAKGMFESSNKYENRIQSFSEKLKDIANQYSQKYSIPINYSVEEGKVETVFTKAIQEYSPNLIVTHQKFSGSKNSVFTLWDVSSA